MPVFSVEVPIVATAYIRADTAEEAERIVSERLHYATLHARAEPDSEVLINGDRYDSPDLPEVSLSPAMTLFNPSVYAISVINNDKPVFERVSD